MIEQRFRCRICGHNRYEVKERENKAGFKEVVLQCTRCKHEQESRS